MKKRKPKSYLFIPIVSAAIVAGIWIGPSLDKFALSVEDGQFKSEIELSIDEEPQAAGAPEKDWQQLVTWGIGALNGLFGAVLIGKKIFSK